MVPLKSLLDLTTFFVLHVDNLATCCSFCSGSPCRNMDPCVGPMVFWPKKVWNNKDFETFFEGHYEEWDFDAKKLGSIICYSPTDHLEV